MGRTKKVVKEVENINTNINLQTISDEEITQEDVYKDALETISILEQRISELETELFAYKKNKSIIKQVESESNNHNYLPHNEVQYVDQFNKVRITTYKEFLMLKKINGNYKLL